MKFIDLFAGLGGFHVGVSELGHKCVFACEKDQVLRELYERNFQRLPVGDIREIDASRIPAHDLICAGFPCQPFSKAGEQKGTDCKTNGDLFFDHLVRILKEKKPKYLLFENVANLVRHNQGQTYNRIYETLSSLGYDVDKRIYSPHQFGIPQVRERVFIVGQLGGLKKFSWPEPSLQELSLKDDIIERYPVDKTEISQEKKRCLDVWQDFLDRSRSASAELPSFPIWAMEFGADYPFEGITPFALGERKLCKHKGSFGDPLKNFTNGKRLQELPSYARVETSTFPKWKEQFIRQNREFYQENRSWIDPWLPKIQCFPPSLQKLEWNCKGEERIVRNFIIQFRASGVRLKRPISAPSLVAMTTTQVPIIGWQDRYMSPRECARLQSLHELKHLPETQEKAYKALGNAVNAELVKTVAKALVGQARVRKKS